jgi:hypothetical protein
MFRTLFAALLVLSLSVPAVASACAMRIFEVDPAVVAVAAPAPVKEIAVAPSTEVLTAAATAAATALTAQVQTIVAKVDTAPAVPVATPPAPTGLVTAMAELDALVD